MNILTIASGDYFSTYGGGQIYVRNLISSLQQKGHNVTVVSILLNKSTTIKKEKKEDAGITVWQITIPYNQINGAIAIELQNILYNPIREIISNISPDLVHANGWKYATSKVCQEINIPCVVTAHHGGIVCPNGMLMNKFDTICNTPATMQNCLKCSINFVPGGNFWSPFVQILPNKTILNIGKYLKSIRNIPYISPAFKQPLEIYHKLQEIEILKYAPDRLIAPSRAIASALIRNGIPKNKVTIIPHGIIPLEKKPLKDGLPKRVLRFGYIGRISYIKGLHVLLEACKYLHKDARYELHIYGDAATKSEKKYKEKLQKNSKNLSIIWHGKINYENIADAYHFFDVMILPSICLEVFGLTLLESLSAGRPVIATKCGGPEDIIKDGINGILVEANNAIELSKALNKCINEPEYVKNLALNTSEINTLEKHVNDLENIYQELCNG